MSTLNGDLVKELREACFEDDDANRLLRLAADELEQQRAQALKHVALMALGIFWLALVSRWHGIPVAPWFAVYSLGVCALLLSFAASLATCRARQGRR